MLYVTTMNSYFLYFGLFIHVPSRIAWYVCSMYLGPKGDFFFRLVIFSPSFCAVCVTLLHVPLMWM